MSYLKVGVFGTSSKENEKRVPIHPEHLDWIEEDVRKNLFFEQGYGKPFYLGDTHFRKSSGGVLERSELFEQCDIILLPKPVQTDFDAMRPQTILWGWPHCVQQQAFTQSAIDKQLTLIAWEAMHRWTESGDWQMHIFHKNNEIAGYAGVLHALGLVGLDGNYGPPKKAVVISFGSVSRGAIFALKGMGFQDITVYTQRYSTLVADQIVGIDYKNYEAMEDGTVMAVTLDQQPPRPFIQDLAEADIIVNGVLQDTDHPLMFVREGEEKLLKPGTMVIDISCDEGMGFYFARPTTFAKPTFVHSHVVYYGVDHTPSYLWNSASWEISNSLLPYLPLIMGGPDKWMESETVKRSIEILNGVIQNPKILTFQQRQKAYPHKIMS